MGISYEGLKSIGLSEHTKKVIGNDNDEVIKYFINTDIGWNYLDLYNWDNVGWHIEERKTAIKSTGHSNEDISFIRELFQKIDKLIDLDFVELDTDNGSEIDIYSIEYSSEFSADTVGEAKIQSSSTGHWWDILWKDTDNKDQVNDNDLNTIIHEIGHALGLSHPYEDPTNEDFTSEDTIMSYNISEEGWNKWFSKKDIQALKNIWGSENDNGSISFENSFSDYKFTINNQNEYFITTEYGNENITNLDELDFLDKTIQVSRDIAPIFNTLKTTDHITGKIYRLYNAAFGRFPDQEGFNYWIQKHATGENSFKQTGQSFIISNEFINLYGQDLSDENFVNQLYTNILERGADNQGYKYWTSQLNKNLDSRLDVLISFSESKENKAIFEQETGLLS